MKSSPASLIALSLLVAGCGGGGSTFNGAPPVGTSFPINGSNGVAVAQLSWEAAVASGGLTDLGGAAGLSGNAPSGSAIAERATRDEGLLYNVISMVPFGPDVFPCEGGSGTVTLSGDLADPFTFSPGDFGSLPPSAWRSQGSSGGQILDAPAADPLPDAVASELDRVLAEADRALGPAATAETARSPAASMT